MLAEPQLPQSNSGRLKGLKFAFLSHEVEGTTGFPEAFAHFLRQEDADLVHIRFPFFISKTKSIWIETYRGENLIARRRSWIRFYQPQLLSFIKDFLWTLAVGWYYLRGADFVLASNNLMGLAALIFRKVGLIKRFAYLVVDYSPRRFAFGPAEWLYVYLDSLIARKADSVWAGNMAMIEGRVKEGRFKLSEINCLLSPMGTYAQETFAHGEIPYNKRDLVFLGNANAKNVRADFLLEVAKYLSDRGEKFRLLFIGPGETGHLQEMSARLGLEDRIIFKGAIPVMTDLERLMASCGIGLAPYDPNLADSFSKYGDPGKIKAYLGCSLPVITTDVPPISHEVQANGAGYIAEFTVQGFAEKILKLWSSEDQFRTCRRNARAMARDFEWPVIFDRLMKAEKFL